MTGVQTCALPIYPFFGESAQLIVDHDGGTLAAFLTGDDGEDGSVDDFLALFSDSEFMGGQPPQVPGGTDEVVNPPHHGRRKRHYDDRADDDDFLESLIDRWFSGSGNGARSLTRFLNNDDDWSTERRKAGHGANHWTQEDRKSTRLNSSHMSESRMPSSA